MVFVFSASVFVVIGSPETIFTLNRTIFLHFPGCLPCLCSTTSLRLQGKRPADGSFLSRPQELWLPLQSALQIVLEIDEIANPEPLMSVCLLFRSRSAGLSAYPCLYTEQSREKTQGEEKDASDKCFNSLTRKKGKQLVIMLRKDGGCRCHLCTVQSTYLDVTERWQRDENNGRS